MAIAPASQLRFVSAQNVVVTSPTSGDEWKLILDFYLSATAKIGSSKSKPEEGWHHVVVSWYGTVKGVNYSWPGGGITANETRIQSETIQWDEADFKEGVYQFHSECSPPEGYDLVNFMIQIYDQYGKNTSPGYQVSANNPTVVWQATHYDTYYSVEFDKAKWEQRTPSAPEGPPSVEILSDGLTARLTYTNLDRADKVKFESVYRDNKGTFKRLSLNVGTVASGTVVCDIPLSAGRKYAFRAYNVVNDGGADYISEPSDYTDWYQTAPIDRTIELFEVIPVSTTEVQARWDNNSSVSFDGVLIQYARTIAELEAESGATFHEEEFDIYTDAKEINRVRIPSLGTGNVYYFRIKPYVNSTSGKIYGFWYKEDYLTKTVYSYVRVPLGTVPNPPTTWTLETAHGYVNDPDDGFYLYGIHNSEDGSACSVYQIHVDVYDAKGELWISYTDTVENKKDEFGEYVKDNLEYFVSPYEDWGETVFSKVDMSEVRWSMRTKGALDIYGQWSIVRTVKMFIQPFVETSMYWSSGGNFPMNIEGTLLTMNQNALQFYFEFISRSNYEINGPLGETRFVGAGDVLYSKMMGPTDSGSVRRTAMFTIGPTEISDLLSSADYRIRCTCYTDAGLSCTDTYDFHYTPTADRRYRPSIAAYEVDLMDRSIYLLPKCFTDDSYETAMDSDLVYLSVYRYNHDGTYTLVKDNITGSTDTWIHDPHPRLDLQIYRVVSIGKQDGIVQYSRNDIRLEAFTQRGLIIQWDEKFERQRMTYQSDLPWVDRYVGKFLYLPFNVDVSESTTVDKTLVNYIGREDPVSYYGTTKAKELSIKTEIPKNKVASFDVEGTLLLLRQLSRYTGDVYVRTFTGVNCWGTVDIDYDINHCELTIPINIKVTPVEGGA